MTVYDPDSDRSDRYPNYPGITIPIAQSIFYSALPDHLPRFVVMDALVEHQRDLRVGGGSVGVVSEFMSRSTAEIRVVTDSAVLLSVSEDTWLRERDWLDFSDDLLDAVSGIHAAELRDFTGDSSSEYGYCISVTVPLASLNRAGVSDVFTVGERTELLHLDVGLPMVEAVLYAVSTWCDDDVVPVVGERLYGFSERQTWNTVNGVRVLRDSLSRELDVVGWDVFREVAKRGGVDEVL